MTFPNDPDLDSRPPIRDQSPGMSWGLPLGIAVVALLLGLFFLAPRDSSTTATNNPPVTTTTPGPGADNAGSGPITSDRWIKTGERHTELALLRQGFFLWE